MYLFRLFTVLTLLAGFGSSFAQFEDDFSDGDFTNNPTWQGDIAKFQVSANDQLQLNDPDATGAATLFTNFEMRNSTTWECFIKMDFAPSPPNFCTIYLQSDSEDFSNPLSGYFLRIGGISGTDDAIELYKQKGTTETRLISGSIGAVGSAPAIARIRVERNGNGEWKLFVDYNGNTDFIEQGTAQDDEFPMGDIFGVFCKYTRTRSSNFFFDDFKIDTEADETAPFITNAEVLSATALVVNFNEPIAENAAVSALNNYSFEPSLTLQSAGLSTQNPTQILLAFSTPLSSLQEYILTINEVEDLAGNRAENVSVSFRFVEESSANLGEVLISEMMPDPTPTVGLPEAEFIELFNPTNKVFQLENWTITSGSNPQSLPEFQLLPQQYVVICDDSNLMDFEPFGDAISVTSFPALSNGGDSIVLRNDVGELIDQVVYTIDWYRDNNKDGGGYTLELINPDQTCKGSENWRASESGDGGTPSQQNSVFDDTPDNEAPVVENFTIIENNQILIDYNEVMNDQILVFSNYTLSNGLTVINANTADFRSVLLTIDSNFEDRNTYELRFDSNIQDCLGNGIEQTPISFSFFETREALAYDILINEIMADPAPALGLPEAEYLELFNRSNKVFDLEGFVIADQSKEVELPSYLLLPGQYVLLYRTSTADFSFVNNSIGINDFLNLTNSGKEIALISPEGTIIHTVDYSIDWYQNASKADGGWSLELINPESACDVTGSNWLASTNGNGGTPGNKNSVFNPIPDTTFAGLSRIFPINAQAVRLFFTEAINQEVAENVENYRIEGLEVLSAMPEPQLYNTVRLEFNRAADVKTLYELELAATTSDCLDNTLKETQTTVFAIPEPSDSFDIVINEILFNPNTGGADFVELYNRSEKIIDLSQLILATRVGSFISEARAVETEYLFFPGDYVVLTEDVSNILAEYEVPFPEKVLESDLPGLGNDEGTIVIYTTRLDSTELLIDELTYIDTWHNELLDDQNGVSLERTDYDQSTQDENNWHSAASAVGFATPTYENSQLLIQSESNEQQFELSSDSFSPNGDGFNDFILLNYEFDRVGYLANVEVYDANGRKVKRLAESEIMKTKGSIKWDGVYEDGTKARIGIYIIGIEYFSPDGSAGFEQFSFAVVGSLE